MQVHIKNLIDAAQGDDTVRELRWPEGRQCPGCDAKRVVKRGVDDHEPARQRDACHACAKRFDDRIGTIFAGHHQPLNVWLLCRYVRGLHWSNEPIAMARALDRREVQQMTTQLREGIVKKRPKSRLMTQSSVRQCIWSQDIKATLWQ